MMTSIIEYFFVIKIIRLLHRIVLATPFFVKNVTFRHNRLQKQQIPYFS